MGTQTSGESGQMPGWALPEPTRAAPRCTSARATLSVFQSSTITNIVPVDGDLSSPNPAKSELIHQLCWLDFKTLYRFGVLVSA